MLLTGAAGFIGSHVAELLAERGHEVVGLEALRPEVHRGRNRRACVPNVRAGDVRDASVLEPLLAGVDAVCHQAAVVGDGLDTSDAPAYASHVTNW